MNEWKRFGQKILGKKRNATQKKPQHRWIPEALYRRIVRPVPKLRLSHQLLGFFVLIVLFPLLVLSFSIYSINQKAVGKQINRFTEHTAEVTYEELASEMTWQEEQAKLAGEYWNVILSMRSHAKREKLIQQFFKTYPDYEAVSFYDPTGKQILLFHSAKALYSDPQLPTTLAKIPKTVQVKLDFHPKTKKTPTPLYSLKLVIPAKLIPDSNRPLGAIGFFKRFPYLGNLITERFKTFNSGFVITNPKGVIIAGPPQLVSQKLSPDDFKLYQSLKEGGTTEFYSRRQSYHIFPSEENQNDPKLQRVIIKMPHLGWGIIIESPYRIQRYYVLKARTQSVGLVFLCILLIIVLGLFYSRGINRNFRQLIKGIKALAEGRYSRRIRLITKSWTPYEIVYLTAEVNRMAGKISSAWTSIQELNQELVYKNQQDLFIAQATQRLHSSLELDAVCETATQVLSERPEILGVLLYLQTEPGKFELTAKSLPKLFYTLTNNLDEETLQQVENHPLFDQAIQRHTTVNASQENLPFLNKETFAILQPIFYQEHPIGLLALIKAQEPVENTVVFDDAMIIDLISSQIGVAIQQARQWEQLQKANKQLAKLDELKSNLIDTVSHELRTPLTNIKGYTSRLIRNEQTLDSATKIKSLKVIKQQADRLGRLVEDLLVIPELEQKEGIRVFPDRVNLDELVHRCVNFIEEKANREIQIPELPEELDVLVDPDRMEQVILNLLDNAIKYSPEGSAIQVSARQSSETMVCIQVFNVSDPILPDELATLFSKFKRLDERLTRTTRGTGLGLFITKGLIEAMGGSIWLEGHEGFRVFIEIPLFEPQSFPTDFETVIMST